MAGGNRSVDFNGNWLLSSMPTPLRDICMEYMRDMQLPSFSYAIRSLLESHPEIDRRVKAMYADKERLEHLEL